MSTSNLHGDGDAEVPLETQVEVLTRIVVGLLGDYPALVGLERKLTSDMREFLSSYEAREQSVLELPAFQHLRTLLDRARVAAGAPRLHGSWTEQEYRISSIEMELQDIGAELYYDLAIRDLIGDRHRLKLHRYVPVTFYTPSGDGEVQHQLGLAVERFLHATGFQFRSTLAVVHGSLLKRILLGSFEKLTSDEVQESLNKGKDALDERYRRRPIADNMKTISEAAKNILDLIEDEGYMHYGNIFIGKIKCNGKVHTIIKELTDEQIVALNENTEELMTTKEAVKIVEGGKLDAADVPKEIDGEILHDLHSDKPRINPDFIEVGRSENIAEFDDGIDKSNRNAGKKKTSKASGNVRSKVKRTLRTPKKGRSKSEKTT